MKFTLNQILPSEVSRETAFQLVQFTRGLALALESIYLDQMLMHPCSDEHTSFSRTKEEKENANPF